MLEAETIRGQSLEAIASAPETTPVKVKKLGPSEQWKRATTLEEAVANPLHGINNKYMWRRLKREIESKNSDFEFNKRPGICNLMF
jgi:uncharacterized protein with HEPN domain